MCRRNLFFSSVDSCRLWRSHSSWRPSLSMSFGPLTVIGLLKSPSPSSRMARSTCRSGRLPRERLLRGARVFLEIVQPLVDQEPHALGDVARGAVHLAESIDDDVETVVGRTAAQRPVNLFRHGREAAQ